MLVSYDGNGNTGGIVPPSADYPYRDIVTLPNPGTLEKDDSIFYSWNTSSDGSGEVYLPGDGYRVVSVITFYAVWLETYVGGLVGGNVSPSNVTDSYWDEDVSDVHISSGGEGKTTEEMMLESTFTSWDFINTWLIDESASYPSFYKVDFSADITSGDFPLTVYFVNETIRWPEEDAPVITHYWNFGDGNTSTELSPVHVYSLPGTYSVFLTETRNYLQETVIKEGYITVTDTIGGYHLISEASTSGGGFARYRGPSLIFD
jgi:PKD repeat protein